MLISGETQGSSKVGKDDDGELKDLLAAVHY